ncbi:MAG: 3-isopropylmalate dehydratase small subunit [Fuerstiella sp.]|nr:3-isopropylmalate dehydratase small subunit [Fuerstiella sp.]
MEKFTVHNGTGAPLRRSNVDTDQIIPAEYLKRITRSGFADGLFSSWRQDPEFVLNQDQHAEATVLIAGPDFGTGSSREHAVWALQDYGFEVVISSRFADIFRGNAGKSGLLPALVEAEVVERLWELVENDPTAEIEIDLIELKIRAGDLEAEFVVDGHVRHRMLQGLDDIGISLSQAEEIDSFERNRPGFKPTTV